VTGRALYGTVWTGGSDPPFAGGVVVVASTGEVLAVGPAADVAVPEGFAAVRGGWVGPALYDAHVHLAFGSYDAMRAGGVVAVRDLGAPPALAASWRDPGRVAVAGPLLTAPGGYPSRSWGAAGFARFVASVEDARVAVAELDTAGVDVVKVALEPAGGAPVPDTDVGFAIVRAAHERGLAVTAHALSEPMVLRALDMGVDELCHTPSGPLSPATVERIADADVGVVSTIETLGGAAPATARALVAAGVRLRYGTDLGNAGTVPGADPRELRRLADAGLGMLGALRAAAVGPVEVGRTARVVVLAADPRTDPETWRAPLAVLG
jgi:imidazolonepropionase-like amidohydrolase